MIQGDNIVWKSGPLSILKGVSFQIREGRITTFMGPSGSGKTTLLKCILNLYSHYEGLIRCEGKDIKQFTPFERASSVGFVLQQFHLFPHLTVLQNCTYALTKVMGVAKAEAEKTTEEILSLLGIHSLKHFFPAKLSGGQQQRVAIARALALHPKILVLDEPTSALDPESKRSLEKLLGDLSQRGITLAISSHDMPFIRRFMDYIYFMEDGLLIEECDCRQKDYSSEGKIKQFLTHV